MNEEGPRTLRLRLAEAGILGTRDGSGYPYPSKDGVIINGYVDKLDAENTTVVKRPGITQLSTFTIPGGGPYYILCIQQCGKYLLVLTSSVYGITTTVQVWSISTTSFFPSATLLGTFPSNNLSGASIAYDPENVTAMVTTAGAAAKVSSTGVVTQITNPNYPATIVQGCVFLDGYYFVMDTNGTIWNSALNDPTTWSALSYVGLSRDIGYPSALVLQLGNVIAFGSTGYQGFYDAGIPAPASPLAPNQSVAGYIGMFGSPGPAQSPTPVNNCLYSQVGNSLFFISSDSFGNLGAYVLEGTQLARVSSPAVDRVFEYNRSNFVSIQLNTLSSLSCGGHTFFICPFGPVYDITTREWYIWTTEYFGAETPFEGIYLGTIGQAIPIALGITVSATVDILQFSTLTYQDNGQTIPFRIITSEFDKTNTWKFISGIDIISDKVNTTLTIRFSDNDYQSWSNAYTANLSFTKANIYNLGRTRRRSFQLLHQDNTPLRIHALDITYDEGMD